jgi:hypothetical protein
VNRLFDVFRRKSFLRTRWPIRVPLAKAGGKLAEAGGQGADSVLCCVGLRTHADNSLETLFENC